MAFKLSAKQIQDRDNIVSELNESHEALVHAAERFNLAVKEAQEFRQEVVDDFQSQYDEKSEGWQEGERGQAVAELISTWENLELEAGCDEPDNIAEELENASTELDG